jgi:hypothetical protein
MPSQRRSALAPGHFWGVQQWLLFVNKMNNEEKLSMTIK